MVTSLSASLYFHESASGYTKSGTGNIFIYTCVVTCMLYLRILWMYSFCISARRDLSSVIKVYSLV